MEAEMVKVRNGLLGLPLVATLALAGLLIPSPAMGAEPAVPAADPVAWAACPEDVADPLKQLQCASIPVPVDYTDPGGAEIQIMVSRLASPAPDERRGILLLNPGGPGESGLTQSLDLVSKGLPVSVSDAYDLIGVDTRGIGHSAPISCGFTIDQGYAGAIPKYAADRAAVAAQAEVVKGIAEQCAANDVDGSLRHVSTANMARDMDRIRIALGEKKISFFGVSYGTALGAAYASMFPDRTDRIVLDSAIGDTHLDREGIRRYGLGAEETFPDFARWAAKRDGTYGLGSTAAEVRKTYFSLAHRLDATPMDGGQLDGHLFRQFTFVSLYNESLYAGAAQFWEYVLRSDAAGVTSQMNQMDAAVPGSAVAPTQLSPSDNTFSVFLAVTCNDKKFSGDVSVYQRAVAEDRTRYPVFGAATANIMPCAFWPYEQVEPPVAIVDDGPENILIVQNSRDPATPHAGGTMLREKFDKRSTLVSVDRTGHGVYIYGDSFCADGITTRFLVGGKMPTKDKKC
ncbi:alpha/beta hydrolase [Lacisediminihabitans sp. FW035]